MQRAYNLPNILLISIINDYLDDKRNSLVSIDECNEELQQIINEKNNISSK